MGKGSVVLALAEKCDKEWAFSEYLDDENEVLCWYWECGVVGEGSLRMSSTMRSSAAISNSSSTASCVVSSIFLDATLARLLWPDEYELEEGDESAHGA